eukprot:3477058-Amphidinium_carterae.1
MKSLTSHDSSNRASRRRRLLSGRVAQADAAANHGVAEHGVAEPPAPWTGWDQIALVVVLAGPKPRQSRLRHAI